MMPLMTIWKAKVRKRINKQLKTGIKSDVHKRHLPITIFDDLKVRKHRPSANERWSVFLHITTF